jgi:hypothetical protein
MEATSRFITAPDLDFSFNYKILLVGATDDDIARITFFCKHSDIAVDIYLHDGGVEQQGWLMNVLDDANIALVRIPENSTPIAHLLLTNLKTVAFYEPAPANSRFKDPLAFFEWYVQNAGKSSS